jgi:hypothetical protein
LTQASKEAEGNWFGFVLTAAEITDEPSVKWNALSEALNAESSPVDTAAVLPAAAWLTHALLPAV